MSMYDFCVLMVATVLLCLRWAEGKPGLGLGGCCCVGVASQGHTHTQVVLMMGEWRSILSSQQSWKSCIFYIAWGSQKQNIPIQNKPVTRCSQKINIDAKKLPILVWEVYWYSSLESFLVIEWRKSRQRRAVSEFHIEKEERVGSHSGRLGSIAWVVAIKK